MLEKYGDFLNVEEASEVLHYKPWSIRDLCRKGKIPSVKIGQRLLIPKQQLIEQLEKGISGGLVK